MSELQYKDKENVLCYHGPLIYEAKVLKGEFWKDRSDLPDGEYYFVHYKGWKQKWDEWVPTSRMMKLNEESLMKQADLKSSMTKKKPVQEKKAAPANQSHQSDPHREKKRRREMQMEKEESYVKRSEIKISIPESLKSQLVDDWENVTKNQKLVTLPHKIITIAKLLDKFYEVHSEGTRKMRRDGADEDSMKQVVEGLKAYFEKALGNILLYAFERHQYVEIKKSHPELSMCEIYGPEHLLRLFVQLPSLIAHTNMDQDSIAILRDHFTSILLYMQKNQEDLFQSEYENAAAEYIALQK